MITNNAMQLKAIVKNNILHRLVLKLVIMPN